MLCAGLLTPHQQRERSGRPSVPLRRGRETCAERAAELWVRETCAERPSRRVLRIGPVTVGQLFVVFHVFDVTSQPFDLVFDILEPQHVFDTLQ